MKGSPNDVVRRFVATSGPELDDVLEYLPYGVRYGVVRDLEDTGRAHRFERLRQCAYYLMRLDEAIEIWRWSYIASPAEAHRLRVLIESRRGRLDERAAAAMFEQATSRSIVEPRLPGMALFASGAGSSLFPPEATASVHSRLPC